MNILSNIGITELMLILLLALLVVGPERLPEVARTVAKTLRDLRKAYDNLTRDLGPELMSIQESTREIRESVESVRSIPKDTLNSVIKAAELDETMGELRDVEDRIRQVGKTVSDAQRMVRQPLKATADLARTTLTGAGGAAADAGTSSTGSDEAVPDVPAPVGQAGDLADSAAVAPPGVVEVPEVTESPPAEQPGEEPADE